MFKDASKSISTYLIPVLCVLYIQFPILRNLIILHMIPISIIGVANAVIQERTPFEKIMIILGHLVFYLLLVNYKPTTSNVNLFAKLVTLLISLVLISSVPTWTYELSREQMIAMYLLIYLMLL
jgi:hypothetical protein